MRQYIESVSACNKIGKRFPSADGAVPGHNISLDKRRAMHNTFMVGFYLAIFKKGEQYNDE